MATHIAPFDAADYLDDEQTIAEYLTPVRRAGVACHADTRRLRGTAAPGRYRHRHARVRRPGHGEGAPPGALCVVIFLKILLVEY